MGTPGIDISAGIIQPGQGTAKPTTPAGPAGPATPAAGANPSTPAAPAQPQGGGVDLSAGVVKAPPQLPAEPNTPHPAEDQGFWHGLYESTIKPIIEQGKEADAFVNGPDDGILNRLGRSFEYNLKNAPPLAVARGVASIARSAYEQGKQAAQHGGAALRESGRGISSLAHGDLAGAEAHSRNVSMEGLEATGHAAAIPFSVAGSAEDITQAGEDIGQGRVGEGIGRAVGGTAKTLLAVKGGSKAASKTEVVAAHPAELAAEITDAVNPPGKGMAQFQAKVQKQLPHIVEYAKKNGITLESRADFFQAAKGAADQMKRFYNDEILGPVRHELVEAPKGYQGGTSVNAQSATLGQMESRLKTLNATLNPAYEQGGVAINAAEKTAMTAEAAALRDVLNHEIASRMGMTPDEVAQIRTASGEIASIRDKTQLALNAERHAANARERAPLTVNPFGKGPRTFVLDKAVDKAANFVRGNPAENGIKSAFEKYQHETPQLPQPKFTPPVKATPKPRTPVIDKVNPGQQPVLGASVERSAAEAKTNAGLQAQRIAENKASRNAVRTKAQMDAAQDALSKKKTMDSHPLAEKGQGGHAGGGVASVEEINRPGQNLMVSKNNTVTFHGKSFAPEAAGPGSVHVTVMGDGTYRVNAGSLTKAQEAAIERTIAEIKKKK